MKKYYILKDSRKFESFCSQELDSNSQEQIEVFCISEDKFIENAIAHNGWSFKNWIYTEKLYQEQLHNLNDNFENFKNNLLTYYGKKQSHILYEKYIKVFEKQNKLEQELHNQEEISDRINKNIRKDYIILSKPRETFNEEYKLKFYEL